MNLVLNKRVSPDLPTAAEFEDPRAAGEGRPLLRRRDARDHGERAAGASPPLACPDSALFKETDVHGQPVLRPVLWYLGPWWLVLEAGRALDEDWTWTREEERT